MLAMGFAGPKAMTFKETYIAAFNSMADYIANHEPNLWQMYRALKAKRVSRRRARYPVRTRSYVMSNVLIK